MHDGDDDTAAAAAAAAAAIDDCVGVIRCLISLSLSLSLSLRRVVCEHFQKKR